MSITSAAPDLQSPFAGFAGLDVPESDEARPTPPPVGALDSPFGAGAQETPESNEDVTGELLDELVDEEFTDAVSEARESVWLDVTWRTRFLEMLQRAEARLHPVDRGPIPTLFADADYRPANAVYRGLGFTAVADFAHVECMPRQA